MASKDTRQVSGIQLGGGIISASARGNASFHWSPYGAIRHDQVELQPFQAWEVIQVAATVEENHQCVRDENEWWSKSCRFFQNLGPHGSCWVEDERQVGFQAGNYVLAQAVVGWKKFQGRTLKQDKLESLDDEGVLAPFLDNPFGVQVSFCTGVSRRVRLRQMLADLMPVFVRALNNQKKIDDWQTHFKQNTESSPTSATPAPMPSNSGSGTFQTGVGRTS